MEIERTGPPAPDRPSGIPDGVEVFAASVDLNRVSPYLRAVLSNPLVPGMVMADGLATRPHSPLFRAGGLGGHYLLGTGIVGRQLALLEGREIDDDDEAGKAIDVKAAADAVTASEDAAGPVVDAEKIFSATTDHNIRLAERFIKASNAAIPVLNSLPVTQTFDFNTFSPGLSLASTGLSAYRLARTFGDVDATPLRKTASAVSFASSMGSLVLDATGMYRGVSDALKLGSALVAFVETGNSGRAVIVGTRFAG